MIKKIKIKIKNYELKISAKRAGFTILEAIVAIAILSLSISGSFSAVQKSLSESIIAKDEIKAFYLAQEAVEIIRNKRDVNQLNKINNGSGNWLAGISENVVDPCYFGKICQVDVIPIPPSLTYCGSSSWGSCPVLNQDPATSLYSYGAYPATDFKREVKIESINAYEIAVIVRVSWTKGLISREFKVKTFLFNWI